MRTGRSSISAYPMLHEIAMTITWTLISSVMLCSGLATLVQVTFGSRLPIIQGGTFSFLGPMFAIVGMVGAQGLGWEVMIRQVSAAVMFASVIEIVLGYTGLMGYVKRAISPITTSHSLTLGESPAPPSGAAAEISPSSITTRPTNGSPVTG